MAAKGLTKRKRKGTLFLEIFESKNKKKGKMYQRKGKVPECSELLPPVHQHCNQSTALVTRIFPKFSNSTKIKSKFFTHIHKHIRLYIYIKTHK